MSNDESHEGEPRNWSTDDLLAWLDDDEKWRGKSRSKLVAEVETRLDEMYQKFTPNYPNVDPVVDIKVLMPWAPWVQQHSLQAGVDSIKNRFGVMGLMPSERGPLKKKFEKSFSPSEIISNIGRSLPLGRHPADDFRHNQCIIAMSCDNGEPGGVVLQDVGQQEAMVLKILGTWFLPPGGKLYPGYKVACHNLHGHALQELNGLTGTVVASAGGMCKMELDRDGGSSSGGAPKRQVEVPNWALLFLKGTNITEGAAGKSRQAFAAEILPQEGWKDWQPVEDDTVVLTGLKARPDLNGRFGQLVKVGKAAGGDGDADSIRHSVKLVKTADRSSEETLLSVKRLNMVAVEEPPPVVVIAYAVHSRAGTPERQLALFMNTQMTLLHPMRKIHCTLREMRCWNRCVEADSKFLASVPAATKKKLLGTLDPKQWKLGVLMPIKRGQVDSAVKKATKEVKAAATCRHCGKHATKDKKLSWCSRCSGVAYCSVECQRADWKARHKQECTNAAAGGSTAAGGSSSGEAGPSGQAGQVDSDSSSVLLPIAAAGARGPILMHNPRSGKGFTEGELQINVHGDKRFLVKVQNSFEPGAAMVALMDPDNERWFKGPFLVYDKAMSVQFHVYPEVSAEPHKKLGKVMRKKGVRGKMNPAGRKIYAWAKREAANLRVFLDDLPSQQQSW